MKKVFLINILILFLGVLALELSMGGWIRKSRRLESLNITRDKKFIYKSDIYTNTPIDIHYSRDKYGLRGEGSFNAPEKINILTIGGSTTDQRFVTDGETWQDILEGCFIKNGNPFLVSNAGIDGQSTFGHIKNFEIWFPLIPNLRPKYVLFYIGINDFYRLTESDIFDDLNRNSIFINKLKSNSAIYSLLRKIQGAIRAEKVKVVHRKIDFKELKYTSDGIAKKDLFKLYDKNLDAFENRVRILIKNTVSIGSTPIFVTQPSMMYKMIGDGKITGVSDTMYLDGHAYNGVDYFNLLNKLNERIRKACGNKYTVIELTSLPIWKEDDFYDFAHNTPKGAKKIGEELYRQLKNLK